MLDGVVKSTAGMLGATFLAGVLAEGTSDLEKLISPAIQGAGTVAVLWYMVRYFMAATKKANEEHRADLADRNKVIECIAVEQLKVNRDVAAAQQASATAITQATVVMEKVSTQIQLCEQVRKANGH